MNKDKFIGLGTVAAGILGVILSIKDAITATNLIYNIGFNLPLMYLAQCTLSLFFTALFAIFVIGGVGILANKSWGIKSIQRITIGIVLITGFTLMMLYPKTFEISEEGNTNTWLRLVAYTIAGIVWPIIFSFLNNKPQKNTTSA